MSLKRDELPEIPVTPCACCPEPESGECWDVPLCDAHWLAWVLEAPSSGEVESRATPEHVEHRVMCEFLPDMVALKPGVLERYMRAWTAQWVRRKAPVRDAAVEAHP